MSEAFYFQRYHQKENVHSSNVLLLLKRLYYYNPKAFYGVIAGWTNEKNEVNDFLPQFEPQTKETNSVPDLRIRQTGFEIAVEAKEKYNKFTEKQLNGHIDGLRLNKSSQIKILVCLSPTFSSNDTELIKTLQSENPDIIIQKITYNDLYGNIKSFLLERHDEFNDILEEFREYCNCEKLIDDTDNTIMAVLSGQSIDLNVKYNLYYCLESTNCNGFRYIGLYNLFLIKYIGKISKIVRVENAKIDKVVKLYSGEPQVTDEEKTRIEAAINENRHEFNEPTNFYLIERYVPVENFHKYDENEKNRHGLMGRKKFYISGYDKDIKLGSCSVEDIAAILKDKKWDEKD
jgi:hypothetical protein